MQLKKLQQPHMLAVAQDAPALSITLCAGLDTQHQLHINLWWSTIAVNVALLDISS